MPLFRGYPSSTKGKPPFPVGDLRQRQRGRSSTASPTAGRLHDGDVVSIDTGCKLNGWCGDAAVTLAIGEVRPRGPEAPGRHLARRSTWRSARWAGARYWSEVAGLMEQYVKSQGMYVVEKFVGHGIGQDMHEEPQVPNFVSKALRKNDIRLEPGVVLAIEPMVALGTKDVKTLDDGWTVVTKDRRLAAPTSSTPWP